MLRNILTKLSGLTTAASERPGQEAAVNCIKSLSPSGCSKEVTKRIHRRSCSHPAAKPSTTNYHVRSQFLIRHGYVRNTCSHHNYIGGKKINADLKTRETKSYPKVEDDSNVRQYKYESSEQYELEASRPRKNTKQIPFNVYEYLGNNDKEQDPMYHLQPSHLTPYGVKENSYIVHHALNNNKSIKLKPPADISIELEMSKGVTDLRDGNHRKNSTGRRFTKYATNIHKLLDKLPLVGKDATQMNIPDTMKKSLKLKSEEDKYQQLGAANTAKQCKQKLIESQVHRGLDSKEGKMDLTDGRKSSKNKMLFRTPLGVSYADNIKQHSQHLMSGIDEEYSDNSEYVFNSIQNTPQKVLRRHSTMSKNRTHLDNSRYTSNKSFSSGVIRKSDPTTLLKAYLENKEYSKESRPYEPKSCAPEPEPNKCFLPSKIRLKPPPCTPKPLPCPQKEVCVRADDCLDIEMKQLPVIIASDCPCVEDGQPKINPTLKRLKFDFKDPPRICPCSPCPCPPRADDDVPRVPKELKPYKPKPCDCIERPPLIDVPMRRLKKVCEPEDVCYPVKPCPKPEPCVRADDCWEMEKKPLPLLIAKDCPCVEPTFSNDPIRMKRLDLYVPEPERVCPKPKECVCDTRADGCLVIPQKELPPLKAKDCPCIDRPMVDGPRLKRLICVDDHIEECYASDPCVATPRADMGCWEYYVVPEQKEKEKKKKVNICLNRQDFSTIKPDYDDMFFNDSTLKPDKVHTLRKSIPVSNFKEGSYFQEGSYINVDMRQGKGKQKYESLPKKGKTSKPDKQTSDCKGACYVPKYHHCMSSCESNKCTEKIPVCCEKQSSPYPAYSELMNPEENAFDRKSHCNTCSKMYGFTPLKAKKLCDVPDLRGTIKDKKYYGILVHKYMTQSLIGGKSPSRWASRQPAILEISESYCVRSRTKVTVNMNPDPFTPKWTRHYSYLPPKCNKNKQKPKKSSHKLPLPPPSEPSAPPKRKAPFPAFTECLNTDMTENLKQRPLDKNKLENLQPHFMRGVEVPKRVIAPIEPNIQTVDTQIEEDCVRKKLCMEKRTVTQHCQDFGKPIKPMRAKDYIKTPIHKDCRRIEQLKKEGRWPMKHLRPIRKFCTCSKESKNTQSRYFSSITAYKANSNIHNKGNSKDYSLKRVFGETFLSVIHLKSFSKSTKSQTCLAQKLKKLNQSTSKLKYLDLADKSLQPKYPILPEIGSSSTSAFNDWSKIDKSLSEAYLRHKFGVDNEGVTLDCSSFGYTDKNLSELFVNNPKKNGPHGTKTCKSKEDITSKPLLAQCGSLPLITREQTNYEQKRAARQLLLEILGNIINYFKPRPNCPPPDAWKKKRLRERAMKAAKAAGLAVCDPKDLPEYLEKLPQIVTPRRNETKSNKAVDSCETSENQQSDNTVEMAKCSSFDPLSFPSTIINEIGSSLSNNECTELLWMSTMGDTNKQQYGSLNSRFQLDVNHDVNLIQSHRYYSKNSDIHNINMGIASIKNSTDEVNNKNTAAEQDILETDHVLIQDPRSHISDEPAEIESNDTIENNEEILDIYLLQLRQMQDFFEKSKAFKDLTFEESEVAKTNYLIWELERILDDLKQN